MESSVHANLVSLIISWVEKEYPSMDGQIFVDDHRLGSSRPDRIGGFYPDILCFFPSINHTIIADAKTPYDLERPHTKHQINAYIEYLLEQKGSTELIIGTRYSWAPSAHSILHSTARNFENQKIKVHNPKFTIISEFGKL